MNKISKDTASIRDQLGNDPDTFPVLNSDYDETVGLEEGPTKISSNTIGHSWIVGSPTNGIVGTNTGTEDGQQQVVGGAGRVESISRIVNPNRTFHEHFRDETFKGSPFTATWDTTNFRLAMNTETDHTQQYVTTATFLAISKNNGTVSRALLSCTETMWGNDVARYFIRTSTTNGWEEVVNGNRFTFTNTGSEVQVMIVFAGNGGSSTYIEDLDIVLS